ncbi:MAG TPA: DUF1657 domain-containing protein [Symbiobacteriaceae bacterium]|nr:DUF1657 domain-containing protein [Symbiobacteriaceae bacterium]
MTVRSDLERSIAMAEANKGSYLLFATESEDEKAKTVFQDMAEDMERHVQILKSRVDYLDQNGGGGGGGGNGDQKKEKNKNKDKQEGNN